MFVLFVVDDIHVQLGGGGGGVGGGSWLPNG